MDYKEYEEFTREFIEYSKMLIRENKPPIPKDMVINNNAACYAIACSINLLFAKSNYSIKEFAHNISKAVTDFLGF